MQEALGMIECRRLLQTSKLTESETRVSYFRFMNRARIIVLSQVVAALSLSLSVAEKAVSQKASHPSHPNLAGDWILDKSISIKEVVADIAVIIVQNDPEIRVTITTTSGGQTRVGEFTYYGDGRGETNPTQDNKGPAKTKTRWEGNKLTIKSLAPMVLPDGNRPGIDFQRTDVWQISRDNVLLWTSALTVNGGSNPGNIPGLAGPIQKDIKRAFKRKQ